jgi:hypothetical protein
MRRAKHEPQRDPDLAAALARLEGEPPMEAVDWERLRRRIGARADGALARLRARSAWWAYAARWGRVAIPIAAAAGIAIAFTLPAGEDVRTSGGEAARSVAAPAQLETAYLSGASPGEAADELVETTDREWLLGQVMGASAR